jgi:hypothetical protein
VTVQRQCHNYQISGTIVSALGGVSLNLGQMFALTEQLEKFTPLLYCLMVKVILCGQTLTSTLYVFYQLNDLCSIFHNKAMCFTIARLVGSRPRILLRSKIKYMTISCFSYTSYIPKGIIVKYLIQQGIVESLCISYAAMIPL